MSFPHVLWNRIRPDALLPTRECPTDPGWDFYWCPKPGSAYYLQGHDAFWASQPPEVSLDMGLRCKISSGWCMKLEIRQATARHGLQVLGGIITPRYIGEISVVLSVPRVSEWERLNFKPGNRIVQGIYLETPGVLHEEGDFA